MIEGLLQFLNDSPVNFLAVDSIARRLEEAGFDHLDPSVSWDDLPPGTQFYVTKNDSSLYAFRMGNSPLEESGIRMISAHCDSPTFRIKPHAEMTSEGGVVRLNVEAYGGAIYSTWLDRPLSLAGRVILKTEDVMHPLTRLLHIRKPLLQIPNLAIHFNRGVNEGVRLSVQKDMLPVMGIVTSELEKGNMLLHTIADELEIDIEDILDFDLYLYDVTPACLVGVHNEFVSSGRLDDLSMVHAALTALVNAQPDVPETTQLLAIFDNEETGSHTKQGAGSPFLSFVIKRLVSLQGGNEESFYRTVEKTFMISADNAHAWHPNYSEKYDPTNHPVMGGGPVIKFNAAQKYISDAASAAVFASICEKAGVPCQKFVNHSDIPGGSTLGNILSVSLPVQGVDIGNPIWAMHSAREMGSVADHEYCIRAFTSFYEL